MTFPFLLSFLAYRSLNSVCKQQSALSGGSSGGPQAGSTIISIKDFAEFLISQERMATTIVTIKYAGFMQAILAKTFPYLT